MLDRHALATHHRTKSTTRVQQATEQRAEAPTRRPTARRMMHLYSGHVDPTSHAFDAEPHFDGEPRTMVDLINLTLREEMRAQSAMIVVFGEDVADCSREESLARGEGQGRRVQGDRRAAERIRLASAASTRRSPKRPSSAAPSGWRRAA